MQTKRKDCSRLGTPSDDRCLYGTVTGVGGMFQNPFLRPGTPQARSYGRYVRLFVIFETPRPRLRENPIFGVNATHRGVKTLDTNHSAHHPKPTGNAPGMTQQISTHVVESFCGCGVPDWALTRCIHTSSYITQRCEKAGVTRSEQVTAAPP